MSAGSTTARGAGGLVWGGRSTSASCKGLPTRASDLVHGGWVEGRYVQPQNVASTESRATARGWETVDTYSSGATEAHRTETLRAAGGGESYVSTFESRDTSGRLTSRHGDVMTSRPDGATSTYSFGRR